jgi:hypothetical protein
MGSASPSPQEATGPDRRRLFPAGDANLIEKGWARGGSTQSRSRDRPDAGRSMIAGPLTMRELAEVVATRVRRRSDAPGNGGGAVPGSELPGTAVRPLRRGHRRSGAALISPAAARSAPVYDAHGTRRTDQHAGDVRGVRRPATARRAGPRSARRRRRVLRRGTARSEQDDERSPVRCRAGGTARRAPSAPRAVPRRSRVGGRRRRCE